MSWKLFTTLIGKSECTAFLIQFEISLQFGFLSRIQIVKDHCMQFIIKEENFTDVVMSNEFSDLDKPLLVEIIRRRLNPCKIVNEANLEKNVGKYQNPILKSINIH